MAAKKRNFQTDFNRLVGQAKVRFKKLGKELGVLARKSEKEIVKASKAGKIQIDIVGLNMQKEKLYYDLGKKVATINAKKGLGISELDSYWKKLRKLKKDAQEKKRELLAVGKPKKKS